MTLRFNNIYLCFSPLNNVVIIKLLLFVTNIIYPSSSTSINLIFSYFSHSIFISFINNPVRNECISTLPFLSTDITNYYDSNILKHLILDS